MVPPSLPSVRLHPSVAVKGLGFLARLRGVDFRKGGHSSSLRDGRTLGAPRDGPYWPRSRKVTQTHPASQSVTAHDFFVGPLLSRGSGVRIPPGTPPLGGPLVARARTQPVVTRADHAAAVRRRPDVVIAPGRLGRAQSPPALGGGKTPLASGECPSGVTRDECPAGSPAQFQEAGPLGHRSSARPTAAQCLITAAKPAKMSVLPGVPMCTICTKIYVAEP